MGSVSQRGRKIAATVGACGGKSGVRVGPGEPSGINGIPFVHRSLCVQSFIVCIAAVAFNAAKTCE